MKRLLIATAAIESGAGLALLTVPSAAVNLLLGSPLEGPNSVTLGRLAGAALLTLGVACWLAPARGLIAAMLLYNLAAVGLLAYAGLALGMSTIVLWAAVALHVAMGIWCIAEWVSRPHTPPPQT